MQLTGINEGRMRILKETWIENELNKNNKWTTTGLELNQNWTGFSYKKCKFL